MEYKQSTTLLDLEQNLVRWASSSEIGDNIVTAVRTICSRMSHERINSECMVEIGEHDASWHWKREHLGEETLPARARTTRVLVGISIGIGFSVLAIGSRKQNTRGIIFRSIHSWSLCKETDGVCEMRGRRMDHIFSLRIPMVDITGITQQLLG